MIPGLTAWRTARIMQRNGTFRNWSTRSPNFLPVHRWRESPVDASTVPLDGTMGCPERAARMEMAAAKRLFAR